MLWGVPNTIVNITGGGRQREVIREIPVQHLGTIIHMINLRLIVSALVVALVVVSAALCDDGKAEV
jgi:hypothetical protein